LNHCQRDKRYITWHIEPLSTR